VSVIVLNDVVGVLFLQSSGAVLVGNLVTNTKRSPDLSTTWVQPFSGFLLDVSPSLMVGNIVSGSEDTGYTIRADRCGVSVPRIMNNEVHAALIGVYILPGQGSNCVEVRSFVAWKCSHVGILTVDQTANLEVFGVVVSDSHIGVSLNFIRPGYGYGLLKNSLVMGSTPGSSCSQSTVCRAMNMFDVAGVGCNSVLGVGWRHVGVMASQYTNKGKTCEFGGFEVCRPPNTPERMCALPWEKRYALPNAIDDADLVSLRLCCYLYDP
jgi:hypothetical protein